MSKSSTILAGSRKFDIVRTKFSTKVTKQLLQILISLDWSAKVGDICKQLSQITQVELEGRYIWMISTNPTYFIQYQIDSYAILKGYNRVILVWKPKYIEYPAIVKITDFGQNLKQIKSMEMSTQEKLGEMSESLQGKISQFVKNYYGFYFFSTEENKFQTNLLTQLKHYVSKMSRDSYWHCAIDQHSNIDVSSKNNLYLRLRIKGIRQKYDKDLIVFSKQGKKQFMLKGKGIQIVSFIAMLSIFLAVISCPSESDTGFCSHKNQMIMGGAAIMMGLMGMRIISRNKNKKKLDKKLEQLDQQAKNQ